MIREKILIVDDETTIQFVLATHLGQLGHEVVHVGSAEEALSRVETQGPFAVAMVDIILPGMTGISLLGRIKELSRSTEVIVMTSHASIDTAIEALRSGAYDYIHKPFELDDVTACVQRALDKRNLSIQNVMLLEQQERHNKDLMEAVGRLRSLNAAANGMSGIDSLPQLLDFLVGLVADELDVERVSLMLRNDDHKVLQVAASRGLPADEPRTLRLGEGIPGEVLKEGKAVLRNRSRAVGARGADGAPATGILCVPVRTPGTILGVLQVTHRRNRRDFDEEDKAYLASLAGQAGVAIERARNGERLREAYETLKTAQDQVVATSRLKAVGEMAAGVAHDFNNVLNGILGRAQLIRLCLKKAPVQAAKALDYADTIEKLSVQGAETVRRIQEFARIRKDRPSQAMDFNQAVRLAVDLTRPKWAEESLAHGVRIEMRLELEDVDAIMGTPEEVGQMIGNLLFNAVEAIPDGGQVTVRTDRHADAVRLRVTDTGHGMSEETRARVFEPFFTTKPTGQGLGMSVVYGIVQRMGGEIAIESQEGEGTTVTVTFPACKDVSFAPKAPAAASKKAGRARIMLVDDDPRNLEVCQDFLTHAGHDVVTAISGSEALLKLRAEPANLVVTDLGMPEMSGLELARTIRTSMPEVRVMILSGWAVQQDDQGMREAGVLRVLPKPIGLEELVEAVDTALAA